MRVPDDFFSHSEQEADAGPTVPIMVDSVMRMDDFQRTRCAYLRVEHTRQPIAISHRPGGKDSPLLIAWGTWAVVSGPAEFNRFLSRNLIESTLDRLEADEQFFFDLGHLWLPNQLMDGISSGKKILGGDLYRASTGLFDVCYRFSAGQLSEPEWIAGCQENAKGLARSDSETKAFREWRNAQIKAASDRYHAKEYDSFRLRRKEGQQ